MQEFRLANKTKWLAVALLAGLLGQSSAYAITALKQVQISNGSQIDLLFDGKVQKTQVRTEFLNDIIQLSIQDVSVYPAKISSVNGGTLTKIFAYQYAPRLVRCRLTVKGKAEDYKDKLDIKVSGRILTVRMQGDHPSAAAPVPVKASSKIQVHAAAEVAAPASAPDEEERALLSRVMAASAQLSAAPAPAAVAEKTADKNPKDTLSLSAAAPVAAPAPASDGGPSTESMPIHLTGETSAKLGGAKPLPSPLKIFGKMGLVLGLFGLMALALKRYARGKTDARLTNAGMLSQAADKGGWLGAVGRIAKKGLSRDGRMIEVLSTHYLGPKKSIAVVRVAGRVLVLGVSNESINLITQLSGEDAAEQLGAADGLEMDGLDLGNLITPKAQTKTQPQTQTRAPGAGATSAGNPLFADLLSAERGKPAFSNPSGPAAYGAKSASSHNPNVRAQIRSRLEGLKQL